MGHKVLLTGGGSGGHVFPALAVGDELVLRGWQVTFAGRPDSIEADIVTAHGVPFYGLAAAAVLGRGPLDKTRAALKIAVSAFSARSLLKKLEVDVVVATGAYVSAPAALAARTLRVPLLLLEPNARPGLANRWLSRIASVAATAFEQTAPQMRCRCRLTGVPVRQQFFERELRPAAEPRWRVLVLGGSQGATDLNRQVPEALAAVVGQLDRALSVLHQTGRGKEAETRSLYASLGVDADVVPFLDDVADAMAEADVVLSRSGAVTLAEICAAAKPSLLFPLRIASGHQVENAAVLCEAGAAEMVDVTDSRTVAEHLGRLMNDDGLQAMSRSAGRLSRPTAAQDIADEVVHLGGAG